MMNSRSKKHPHHFYHAFTKLRASKIIAAVGGVLLGRTSIQLLNCKASGHIKGSQNFTGMNADMDALVSAISFI